MYQMERSKNEARKASKRTLAGLSEHVVEGQSRCASVFHLEGKLAAGMGGPNQAPGA